MPEDEAPCGCTNTMGRLWSDRISSGTRPQGAKACSRHVSRLSGVVSRTHGTNKQRE